MLTEAALLPLVIPYYYGYGNGSCSSSGSGNLINYGSGSATLPDSLGLASNSDSQIKHMIP
jgi:hypothetical protein